MREAIAKKSGSLCEIAVDFLFKKSNEFQTLLDLTCENIKCTPDTSFINFKSSYLQIILKSITTKYLFHILVLGMQLLYFLKPIHFNFEFFALFLNRKSKFNVTSISPKIKILGFTLNMYNHLVLKTVAF